MDKDLTYELKSNVPSQVITADGNLLARLFDNLINNAIKYGAEGKKVLVQVLAKDDIVTVSVTNYGYVIPAEELPLIFNKSPGLPYASLCDCSVFPVWSGTGIIIGDLFVVEIFLRMKVNYCLCY